jgi:predicted Holliday junction resolvase-like endonuclease
MLEIVAVVGLVFILGGTVAFYHRRLRQAQDEARTATANAKRLAASLDKRDGTARATIKGQIAEQIAPMLPGFPFTPSDFRFLGQPIDFIAYVGLTEAKEGLGDIKEVVIGDIKMGSARLSPHQQMIKRAVDEGRVRWETIHLDREFRVRGHK